MESKRSVRFVVLREVSLVYNLAYSIISVTNYYFTVA